ncbi:MAG TPA: choice-of-anchor tandem repeat GloVer-containing protein [Rhizomicrobium sp.]|nr:choice-of-anchor tandem repeat GloVer-containing protein [Rhizomicrobium sp.]
MSRLIFGLCAGGIGLACCLPGVAHGAASETTVYSFCSQANCADGSYPDAGMLDINGTLYGTTAGGGANDQGTVFTIDPGTGAETVLYSFCSKTNCSDGSFPDINLIEVNGKLYGTTGFGGNADDGAVFSLDISTGREKVLYSFCSQQNCTDGADPYAGLVDVKGTLYGTTANGGANCESNGGCGTVFALDPRTGAETVLYSFCSQQNCTDGKYAYAGLVEVKGMLYGTTGYGGADNYGTVFALDPTTGTETVLHSFAGDPDGGMPYASLIKVNDKLYGTTSAGGTGYCFYLGTGGCGTVFAFDLKTGTESQIYAFCSQENCVDGANPFANLIDVGGMLYGTTVYGGANDRTCNDNGCGTVFSIGLQNRVEQVLYSFCKEMNCADGSQPNGSLVDVGGTLYSTTYVGGAGESNECVAGCGVVFAVTP